MLNKSNVRFRGKDIDNLTIEELRIALMQALNHVAELEAAQQGVQADVLESPTCCASFVAYGVHHEDCRNNPARR